MSRRMSVSMTLDAVRARTKTVTRRHVDTWAGLKTGDRLTLIEKGMGLPKGARQVVVAEVEVVDVRVETIGKVLDEPDGVEREGFDPALGELWFAEFWLRSHGYKVTPWGAIGPILRTECRRIEWRYLDEATA